MEWPRATVRGLIDYSASRSLADRLDAYNAQESLFTDSQRQRIARVQNDGTFHIFFNFTVYLHSSLLDQPLGVASGTCQLRLGENAKQGTRAPGQFHLRQIRGRFLVAIDQAKFVRRFF